MNKTKIKRDGKHGNVEYYKNKSMKCILQGGKEEGRFFSLSTTFRTFVLKWGFGILTFASS